MLSNLINLLPHEYSRTIQREYLLRVIIVGILCATAVVIASGVFLIPSFLYIEQEIQTHTTSLDRLSTGFATTEEQEVNEHLTTLAAQATYLEGLSSSAKASATLRAVMAVPHTGISLTHFTFAAPAKGKEGTLQIMGIASTRTALQNYNTALGQLSFITNSNLPISDFAQATKIPFTITLTGTFVSQ